MCNHWNTETALTTHYFSIMFPNIFSRNQYVVHRGMYWYINSINNIFHLHFLKWSGSFYHVNSVCTCTMHVCSLWNRTQLSMWKSTQLRWLFMWAFNRDSHTMKSVVSVRSIIWPKLNCSYCKWSHESVKMILQKLCEMSLLF